MRGVSVNPFVLVVDYEVGLSTVLLGKKSRGSHRMLIGFYRVAHSRRRAGTGARATRSIFFVFSHRSRTLERRHLVVMVVKEVLVVMVVVLAVLRCRIMSEECCRGGLGCAAWEPF